MTDAPKAPLVSRRAALFGTLALVALAALWLWKSVGPPPMDGHGRQFFGMWRTRHVAVALVLGWSALALVFAGIGRRALTRFLIANASFVACWLLLEVVGIAGLVNYPAIFTGKGHEQLGMRLVPHVDHTDFARADLADSWGLAREPIAFRFQTDRYGFRNVPDRESADVYCLGDSFLVAGLVPQADILPAQLEQRLQKPVMGIALVGLSPQAEEKLLLDSKLPLEGRLVLHFVFEGNDLLDSAAWRSGKKGEQLTWKERTLLNQLVVRIQLATQPQPAYVERRSGWIGDEAYRFGWLRSSFEGLDGEIEPVERTLQDLRDRVRAAGGTYAVVVIPSKIRVLGPLCRFAADSEVADWRSQCGPLPEALRTWGEREKTPVLDLTEALSSAAARGEVPWFPADTHWNSIGHRVAAEAIAAWGPVREATRDAR